MKSQPKESQTLWLAVVGFASMLLGFYAGQRGEDVPVVNATAAHPYRSGYPVEVLRVIDGDTLVGRVSLPWGETSRDITFRAADFDAWEASKRRRSVTVTDEEVAKGKDAKDWLAKLVKKERLRVQPMKEGSSQDKYGRALGVFYVQGDPPRRLADMATESGHVRTETQ